MIKPLTYRELDPFHDWPEPDASALVGGHVVYAYDEGRADAMLGFCRESGATEFIASPDLVFMLVPQGVSSAHSLGYHLVVDESLPENTVKAL